MEMKDRKIHMGRRKSMEKLLTFMGVIGVSLVLCGTMAACGGCKAGSEVNTKNAATQVEIGTNIEVDDKMSLDELIQSENPNQVGVTSKPVEEVSKPKPTQSVIISENDMQNKIESAEERIKSEALEYWNNRQADLELCINNGLEFSEFEENYLYYRAGLEIEGLMDKDSAYAFTLIEMKRLYETVKGEYDSLDTKTNITLNNGKYEFTEEFIGTMSSYSYFEGATQQEFNDFLQELAPVIDGLSGKDVNEIMQMFNEGNLHKELHTLRDSDGIVEEPTPAPSKPAETKPTPAPSKPAESKTTPTPEVKEPAVEDDYDWFDDLIVNEDGTRTSSDGTFTFDDPSTFGGGGQGTIPEGFLGFH